MPGRCSFPTVLGPCALAWNERGICAVQLLPVEQPATEPPPALHSIIQRIQRHLEGQHDPLLDVDLDFSALSPFARKISTLLRRVRPGQTTTYAELARRAGGPGAARAVGQAMAHNPFPLLVPCHRVLGTGGSLGGFSAPGQLATKLRLLTVEGVDLRPIARWGTRELGRRDPRLGEIIARVGPFPLLAQPRTDPFTALVECIVHQQVSMRAGASICARLRASYGNAEGLSAARLARARARALRAAGLSRQKQAYVRQLAAQVVDGALPLAALERMDDAPVIKVLTGIKGIGQWSAEMFLIFRLGRLDVLPLGDLGLRKAMQQLYGVTAPARLQELATRWVPLRSIATWYLWRYLELRGADHHKVD